MKKIILLVAAAASFASCSGNYTGKVKLANELDSVSYAIGSLEGLSVQQMTTRHPFDTIDVAKAAAAFGLAKDFSKQYKAMRFEQFDTLDFKVFMHGFMHAATGKGVQLEQEVANLILNDKFDAVRDMRLAKQAEEALENAEKNKAFLAEYAQQEGVDSLNNGIYYKVLVEGKGQVPAVGSQVKVNYEGRLVDGTVFDSSYDRNEPLTCNTAGGLIPGWLEALKVMPVGSTWEVVIPAEQGYGNQPAGRIPAGSTLVFKIELLEIVK